MALKRYIVIAVVLAFAWMAIGQLNLGNPFYTAILKASSGASSSLNTSLIAYWKMDETSGTRVDSEDNTPDYDLTDNNTVNSTNGTIGNSAWFISANSESLSYADDDIFSPTNQSFSFAGWVLLDTLTGGVVNKYNSAGNNREYRLIVTSSKFRFDYSTNGVSNASQSADTFGTLSTNTWYFVAIVHDAVASLIKISVNAGAFDTRDTGGHWPTNGNMKLEFNTQFQGGSYGNQRIDEIGYWLKALTSDELTELYNAGAGKTCCPF